MATAKQESYNIFDLIPELIAKELLNSTHKLVSKYSENNKQEGENK